MFKKFGFIVSLCFALAACGGGGGGGGSAGATAAGAENAGWAVVGSPSKSLDLSGTPRTNPPSMGALEADDDADAA